MIKINEGKTDRTLRVIAGFALIAVTVITQLYWLLIIAAILLVTAATGFCGIYALFGINTCKIKTKQK